MPSGLQQATAVWKVGLVTFWDCDNWHWGVTSLGRFEGHVWRANIPANAATSCKHIDLGEYQWAVKETDWGPLLKPPSKTWPARDTNPCASSTSILGRQQKTRNGVGPRFQLILFCRNEWNDQGLLWGCRKSFSLHDALPLFPSDPTSFLGGKKIRSGFENLFWSLWGSLNIQ